MRFGLKVKGASVALAMATVPVPAIAQFTKFNVGDLIEGLLGALIGEIIKGRSFKNTNEATPKGTCQLESDAANVVDGVVYNAGGQQAGNSNYICNGVKVDGLSNNETQQFMQQYQAAKLKGGRQGTGEATIYDKKGKKKKVVRYSWGDGGKVRHEAQIRVVSGVDIPKFESDAPDSPYYLVNVKTRLNLRNGPSLQKTVTGQYLPNSTVRVTSIFTGLTTKRCKSGRWALLHSNGAGVGYVCTQFLKSAPLGTTDADIDGFVKPRKGRAIFRDRGNTYDDAGVIINGSSTSVNTSVAKVNRKGKVSSKTRDSRSVYVSHSGRNDQYRPESRQKGTRG